MKKIGPDDAPIQTMMILDDDEMDHKLAEFAIERSQSVKNLVSFLDAREALDFLVNEKPDIDVLIVDLRMPLISGFDFLTKAQEMIDRKFARIVVMLTSSLDPSDIERAKELVVVREYLSKPLKQEHISHFEELLAINI